MNAYRVLFWIAAGFAATAVLQGMAAVFWVTRRRTGLPDFHPPVTIFKPLKGVDEGLEENLRTFFQLDYPVYQLLFCVADADDPAIVVVERLLAEFPQHDAQLIVGCPAFGVSPKINSLVAMDRHRKHGTMLLSDSNVRVRPSYLSETACYLCEPGVGLVTNPVVGVGESGPGAVLENLLLNGYLAGSAAATAMMRGPCVTGKSLLIPVELFEAIGGFAGIRNLAGEDSVIGMRVQKAGYAIRLSHHVVANFNRARSVTSFLSRHSRWYKIRKQLLPYLFALEPMANPATVGVAWVLGCGWGRAGLGMLLLVGLGIARDALQTRRLRGSFPKLHHLLLSPVTDLLLFPIWFGALVNNRVEWRGQQFTIGRLTELRPVRAPARVYRRVRPVGKLGSQHHEDRLQENASEARPETGTGVVP